MLSLKFGSQLGVQSQDVCTAMTMAAVVKGAGRGGSIPSGTTIGKLLWKKEKRRGKMEEGGGACSEVRN